MPTLQVVVASTRPGRQGPLVGAWFLEQARAHGAFDVELVDLAEVNLPLLDEPAHPRLRRYEREHTEEWSRTVARADAFVLVTPEYDHGPPAALTNALQYLVQEWAYKPVGFVSYGGVSAGTRAVQAIKPIATALRMMPIPEAVAIPFFAQHVNAASGAFDPGVVQERAASAMLDELSRWAAALRSLREPTSATPEAVDAGAAAGAAAA
jgi:NAD(P)H-dependent FMN reductase